MALGTNQRQNSGPLIFLSPYSKDKDGNKVDSHFAISRIGEDGKIARTAETTRDVTGDLFKVEVKERVFKVEVKERVFKGIPTKRVHLYLRDNAANESYCLDLSFRMSTRSLFNSLASLETFDNLAIGVYDNRKGFETFSLKQNGEKTQWKYPLESQPEPTEVTFKGKVMRDYSVVDKLFEDELLVIAKKLGGSGKTEAAPAKAAPQPTNGNQPKKETPVGATKAPKTAQVEDDSSVPF